MPAQKGRKRKAQRDRRAEGTAPGPSQTPAAPVQHASASATPAAPIPSRNARMTGFMIAIITALLAIIVVRDAIANGSGAESVIRILTGVSLIALAILVGALVLFPAHLRDYFARRRAR